MRPILFYIGGFQISSFIAFSLLGTMLGFFIFHRRLRSVGLASLEIQALFLTAGLLGVLLSRMWYFSEKPHLFTWMGMVNGPGLRWHAFFIGATITMVLGVRFLRVDPGRLFDAAALAVAPGQAVGRIGCILVGDSCMGRYTELPWGVMMRPVSDTPFGPFHPTPIYEAVNLLLIYVLLLQVDKKTPRPWVLALLYIYLSGLQRFVVQFWRGDKPFIGPLTTYHFIALTSLVAGLAGLAILRRQGPLTEGS